MMLSNILKSETTVFISIGFLSSFLLPFSSNSECANDTRILQHISINNSVISNIVLSSSSLSSLNSAWIFFSLIEKSKSIFPSSLTISITFSFSLIDTLHISVWNFFISSFIASITSIYKVVKSCALFTDESSISSSMSLSSNITCISSPYFSGGNSTSNKSKSNSYNESM